MRTQTMISRMSGERLDYLDAVRAFALLLGIVFHAGLSFVPVFIGWAVMDVSTSPLVSVFSLVSHSFRMEVFFLIAGFFSAMVFHRQGTASFLTSRLVRIGIPFVVGWFLLRPLIVSGWVMGGQSLRGDVDIMAGLREGFLSLARLPTDLFVGSHLWFLYYLLLVTAITLVLRAGLERLPVLGSTIREGMSASTSWVATSRFGLLALAAVTAVSLWFMSGWGMDTPDKSLVPHWPVLCVYLLCFGLGWQLHRNDDLMGRFSRLTFFRFVLCAVAVAVSIHLGQFQGDPGHPDRVALRAGFVISYAIMMWTLVALCIGVFRRFFDRPSPVVRYVADASYWLYLVHLPIVVWLQVAVAEWPIHWSLKLIGISVFTIGVSLLLYDLFVRSTLVGRVLNGRRRPRKIQLRGNRAAMASVSPEPGNGRIG